MEELLNPNWCIGCASNQRDAPPYAFSNKYNAQNVFHMKKRVQKKSQGFLKTEKKSRIDY